MKKLNHGKRSITLIVVLFTCLFMLAGCQNVVEEQSEEVTATVTDIHKHSSYITYYYSPATKTMLPQSHPARYHVTITYEDLSQEFNNRNLYDSVSVGDTIQVILYKGWNSDGELVVRELRIP